MLIGLALVFTPLFGIVHELAHVVVGALTGAKIVSMTWTTSTILNGNPVELMAGPIVDILFVYAIGYYYVGFDTMYILFFPFVMHGGLDWNAAQQMGFNGEVLFLAFTAIMVALSIRRVRNVRFKSAR